MLLGELSLLKRGFLIIDLFKIGLILRLSANLLLHFFLALLEEGFSFEAEDVLEAKSSSAVAGWIRFFRIVEWLIVPLRLLGRQLLMAVAWKTVLRAIVEVLLVRTKRVANRTEWSEWSLKLTLTSDVLLHEALGAVFEWVGILNERMFLIEVDFLGLVPPEELLAHLRLVFLRIELPFLCLESFASGCCCRFIVNPLSVRLHLLHLVVFCRWLVDISRGKARLEEDVGVGRSGLKVV